MDDPGGGGPADARLTLTNLVSTSDNSLSPVSSKLVERAVVRAHCRIAGSIKPSGAIDGTKRPSTSGNGSRRNSEICEETSKRASLEKGDTNAGSRKGSGQASKRGSLIKDIGLGGGSGSKKGSPRGSITSPIKRSPAGSTPASKRQSLVGDTEPKRPSGGGRSNRASLTGGEPGSRTPKRQSKEEPVAPAQIRGESTLETPRDSVTDSTDQTDHNADSSILYLHSSIDQGRFSAEDSHPDPAYTQFAPEGVEDSFSQNPYTINNAPSDSTQVLVGVAPFPEESELRVGPTESYMKRHTITIDSEVGDVGHHLHRNVASVELETLHLDSVTGGERIADETVAGGATGIQQQQGAGDTTGEKDVAGVIGGLENILEQAERGTASRQDLQTLMDEMAGEVAKNDVECVKNFSKGLFHEVYKRFSEIVKNAAANVTLNSASGAGTTPVSVGPVAETQGSSGSPKLPSEVKDQLLRTLSDIKSQLESVRSRLKK